MAYLRQLPRPTCAKCGKPATCQVINWRNALMGTFCDRCGKTRCAEVSRDEKEAATR